MSPYPLSTGTQFNNLHSFFSRSHVRISSEHPLPRQTIDQTRYRACVICSVLSPPARIGICQLDDRNTCSPHVGDSRPHNANSSVTNFVYCEDRRTWLAASHCNVAAVGTPRTLLGSPSDDTHLSKNIYSDLGTFTVGHLPKRTASVVMRGQSFTAST
jgi:hypothetical protein